MGESDGKAYLSLPFGLRFFEMITSIVAFAVVVEYKGDSKINYIMFTGITGLVISFFFMIFYLANVKAIRGKASAVVDALWWVFWLAAAAVATNLVARKGDAPSDVQASCAFCWMSWVLWSLSLIVSIREVQGYEY